MVASWLSRLLRCIRIPGSVVSNSFLTTDATESRIIRPALVEMMSSSNLSSLTEDTANTVQRHDQGPGLIHGFSIINSVFTDGDLCVWCCSVTSSPDLGCLHKAVSTLTCVRYQTVPLEDIMTGELPEE